MKNNVGIKMPSGMTIGPPTLRVKNIQKQLEFYKNNLGLQINRTFRDPDNHEVIELGFGGKFLECKESLLILKHDPNAKDTPHDFSGLYHFAILVPNRQSLASAYSSIKNSNVLFDGFADHLVSESLYLHDPEYNGIEIYRDKPKYEWPHDEEGRIIMDSLPLDLESLMDELPTNDIQNTIFPNGTKIGHVHLRVTNLEKSLMFYKKLGLDVTVDWSASGACFLAAGNYHHHIAINTWHSLNGKLHTKNDAGLDVLEIRVPEISFIKTLAMELGLVQKENKNELWTSDPDGIQILIRFQ
ncbi:MAG: VOC family protein [Nitrosotalea sp.]